MNNFLSIYDVVLSYPFDLITSLILFFFFITLSYIFSKRKKILKDQGLNFLFFYLALLAMTSQILLFISFIYYDYLIIRSFMWIIIIVFTVIYFQEIKEVLKICLSFFNKNNFLFFILLSFFLISILPTLDADSLDYHLGFGLDIINNKLIQSREDWLHFRLAGSGEFLNLLGLTFGGRNFGQLLQFSSCLILLISINSLNFQKIRGIKNSNIIKNINLLLFSSPIILVLMFSQKYQFFGSSLVFYSFTLIYFYLDSRNKFFLYTACLVLCFLVTLKHSYIITALIVFAILIFKTIKNNHLFSLLKILIIGFLFLNLPFFLKNLYFYNDPISPLLEHFKFNADQDIVNFSQSIKIADEKISFLNFPFFIISFFIPLSKSTILHFFGLPALALLFAISCRSSKLNFFLYYILFSFLFFVLIGHDSLRYYVDLIFVSILVCKLSLKKLNKNYYFKKLIKINKIQSLAILILNIILFMLYVPKGFNDKNYEKILSKFAPHFNEIKWIETNVPKEAIVISENVRSNALYSRKFVSQDVIKYFNKYSKDYENIFKKFNINYVILDFPIKDKFKDYYKKCALKKSEKRKIFELKTKNPLSKYRIKYEMILFKNQC